MLRVIGGSARLRARRGLVSSGAPAAAVEVTASSALLGSRRRVVGVDDQDQEQGGRRWLSSTAGGAEGNGVLISVEIQRKILSRCDELQSWLEPINQRLRGPLEKCSDKAPLLPFVFLLGNHSSGKSSFINYVLGRNVQTAGVAPTDDAFTIIAPGPSDIDQDGPALIGDPDMGFSGLRHFGPDLIHHTQLKIRSSIATQDLMLVDSPGMIDSPVTANSRGGGGGDAAGPAVTGTLRGSRQRHMDRGYDFQGVCKWFADRADVILLFFDPDKPGTTGETLSILTESLAGMDHKLYIVLNKADQFRKIHDFARAYGSLCWNLSKVIPRKDLPRIYTMCLPVQYQKRGDHLSLNQRAGAGDEEASSLGQGLVDLERSRDEVVGEVRKAPKRRIDNVITRLADSVHLVQMHARVLEALRADYARELWTYRAGAAGLVTAGAGLVAGGAYLGLAMQPLLAFAALYTAGSGGFLYYNGKVLGEHETAMASPEGLRRVFERLYARQVLEGDAFVTSLWKRTYQSLQMVVDTQGGLARLPRATNAELRELERILDEDVPALRRLAAPVQWTYKSGAGVGGAASGGPRPIPGVARSFANMIGGGGAAAAGASESGSQADGGERRAAGESSNVPYRTLGAPGMAAGVQSPPPPAVNATSSSYTSWKVE